MLEAVAQHEDVRLFSSAALLEELAIVLSRPAATKQLAIIGKTVREVLSNYADVIELVEPTAIERTVPRNPDDDRVIAAALCANADLIVSGDADLLGLKEHGRILIVRPAEALEFIEKRQG